MAKKTARFEMYKDVAGKFRFRLIAPNGKIILVSQAYLERDYANRAIKSVRKNAEVIKNYKLSDSLDGKYFFTLRSGNRKVIAVSEMYDSTKARAIGLQAVRTYAASADKVDKLIINPYVK